MTATVVHVLSDRGDGIEQHPGVLCEVIGRLRIVDEHNTDLTPTGPLQRRLLSMLLLRRGHVVPVDVLAEALWPGPLPADHAAGLHTHVFRLRRRIPALTIDQHPPGYVLRLDGVTVDVDVFESAVATGIDRRADDPRRALDELDRAATMWRGRPFDELAEVDEARIEADRLTELRIRCDEERFDLLLELGRPRDVIADVEALVARAPLRERPRELLMRALAATGRRAEALRTFDDFRRRLADELGIEPSGHLCSLNDRFLVDEPAAPTAAGPRSTVAGPGTVSDRCPPPRLSRPLVGRSPVVAKLDTAIAQSRVVTLVGTGGVGKTTVAIDAATRLAGRFPGGVCFQELTGSSPGTVGADLLAAMGAEPRAGVPTGRRIADLLDPLPTLIVLDNCEHVLDDVAAVVEDLVAHCGSVSLLATSRERLAVAGETLVAVPPLRWSDPTDPPELPPAIALFVERAHDIGADLETDPSTLGVIAEICRHLDGLPLAIELAATRLRSLGLEEIRDGIRHSHRLLSGGRRAIPRHRSMAAALSWSFDLLDEPQRDLMSAIAVFSSPFGQRDAAAVAEAAEPDVAELLVDLVERSLLQRIEGRFALLEPVRQFVNDKYVDAGARVELARRHARHVTAVAEELARDMRTERAAAAFARSRLLVPDMRAAFRTALADGDVDLGVRLCTAIRDPAFQALLPEPLTWALELAEVAARSDHPGAPVVHGIAALGAWKAGDVEHAQELVDAGVRAARRLGVAIPYIVADMSGTCAAAVGRLDESVEWYETALSGIDADDPLWRSETWSTLAGVKSYRHDTDVAELADRLVGELLPPDCPVGQAWCWYGAGEAMLTDDPDLARERLARAIELARSAGSSFVEVVAGASLASLEARHGRPVRAAAEYRWVLPLMQRGEAVSPLRTALRSVTELLVRCRVDEPAAMLLGALTGPNHGGRVFGDDAVRLERIRDTLADRLGVEPFERAVAAGAVLDDAAATSVALVALAEHLPD